MFGDTEHIAIRLFGVPRFEVGKQAFFPAKGFVLIAAILLSPGQILTRQAAASLLWEDVEQKRAMGNLRQLLSRLQSFASEEDPLIVMSATALTAGPMASRSDLALFLSAVQSDDIAVRTRGLLAVEGELLHGADTGQEQFHLWLLSERNRMKDLFFGSLGQLLEDTTRFGGRTAAQIPALADCALRLEEDREETYRMVIAAYARAGDLAAGERIYDRLVRQLRIEGRGPEPATLALRRRVQGYAASHGEKDSPAPIRATGKRPRVAFIRPARIDGASAGSIVQAFVEDIANSLVRFRTFAVLSPHSSFAAGSRSDDSYGALRADYRVEATVFDQMRVSFALIEEETGEIKWALEVVLNDRQLHAAFRLLSKQVAAALAEQIERLQMEPTRLHDAGAYHHLLSGQQMLSGKCDLPLLRRSRAEFRKAADLDPGMSVARARIAQTLQLEWLMLGGNDPHLLHRAKAEAEASVESDPALGIGHWMSAVVALYQRDFETSAQKFFEAEALAPNSADLLLQHADALAHFGELSLAWERFQQAIDLNPFAPDIYWWAGASIALKREEYQTALQLCGNMEDDEPALRVLTASHALSGNLLAARETARRLQENYPGMTAREISGLSPDRNPAANEKLFQAFRLAGIK
ncbi:transcriptional regulator, SARP family [Rhizobium sp. PDO1-076]|uniref:BTAD domain-containing putative transcriptional regulator n=1 Tax=Rhizobium sp. PDO1-076 TaxID=1125979 RepID=UPI00024E274B|nr:BTAD domain-containing putative transcriptional regulator [uncultured Rhizobium sp.]EHS52397.1 transcriptional regulator, SARP family [Rhizobium sp. PDO1-076]